MSPQEPSAASWRVLLAFACAALEPGLTGVLLFDLDSELIEPAAREFASILQLATGRRVRRSTLGAATRDEELWLRPSLRVRKGRMVFTTAPGPLVDNDPAIGPRMVIVPDLVRLSLAGARAAVQTLGADVASVERYGFRARWRPHSRWLAACQTEEVAQISPHLLDRFPIRVNAADLQSSLTAVDLVLGAISSERANDELFAPLPDAWQAVLARRGRARCSLSNEAAGRIIELLGEVPGSRRAIALARLTRALAVLDGARVAGVRYVEAAARLVGLRDPTHRPAAPALADSPAAAMKATAPAPRATTDAHRSEADADHDHTNAARAMQPLFESGRPDTLEAFLVEEQDRPASPYPEDEAQPFREFAPLQTPWQRRAEPSSTRGQVVGVQRTTSLRDLAFVPTVMEAAKYQNLPGRRGRAGHGGPAQLVVSPSDLRSYVRAPAPARMLVMLLDHTCRKGWDWQDALAPYLQWAYVSRANTCVIEVGSRDTLAELRASKFTARSALDPRIGSALYQPAGRASPLAHGLELTRQVLRHAFQHQSSSVDEAWLVVVSDGRGNVPLQCSLTGQMTGPVGREGVEDALTVAGDIGAMEQIRLHTVVVDAASQPYSDLPFQLARAMRGVVVAGRAAENANDAS
jgi:magnesium chelatase subunit D